MLQISYMEAFYKILGPAQGSPALNEGAQGSLVFNERNPEDLFKFIESSPNVTFP